MGQSRPTVRTTDQSKARRLGGGTGFFSTHKLYNALQYFVYTFIYCFNLFTTLKYCILLGWISSFITWETYKFSHIEQLEAQKTLINLDIQCISMKYFSMFANYVKMQIFTDWTIGAEEAKETASSEFVVSDWWCSYIVVFWLARLGLLDSLTNQNTML